MQETVTPISAMRAGRTTAVIIVGLILLFGFRAIIFFLAFWNIFLASKADTFISFFLTHLQHEYVWLFFINVLRAVLLSITLSYFLKARQWAYVFLLSWLCIAVGIDVVTYFVTGDRSYHLYFGLAIGAFTILCLLQKNVYKAFEKNHAEHT